MSAFVEPTQDTIRLVSKNESRTVMETCEFTYEWTFENCKNRTSKTLTSPSFSSHYSGFDDKWNLQVFSNYTSDDQDNKTLLVDLQLQSFNNTSQLQTKCRVSFDNYRGMSKEYNFNKFPEKMTWDFSRSIFSNPQQLSQKTTSIISCTIAIILKKQQNYFNAISLCNSALKLSVDLEKLLSNEKSADVTIQVGKKSFHAIKGILAVRSPVFSAMFDHGEFVENKKNEVVIEDIDEAVFEEFLHFIYTDESPNVGKMPMELLAVAEKYQVDCLKFFCEEVICGTITFENVASLLVFSDKYDLKKLRKKCLEFLKLNLRALFHETFQIHENKYPEVFVSVHRELLLSANSVNYS